MLLKKIIILSILLFANALWAKSVQVGVLYWSMNIPGQVAMRGGLEYQVKKMNSRSPVELKLIKKVAGDGDEGIKNQIRQMYQMVDQGVDLIIIQPTDSAALIEPLVYANKHKIPVIAYDQFIPEGKLESFVTSDNYQAGFLGGEYIADQFKENHVIKVVLVEYPRVSSTVERVNGFFDALGQIHQQYRIVGQYEAVEPVGGHRVGQQIVKDFGIDNQPDVVFTVNDGGGLAIADELERAGMLDVKMATVDGDPKSVERIRNNKLIVIDSAQLCAALGAETAKIAFKLLKGERIPELVKVPVYPVTSSTIARYPGWSKAEIPPAFEKSWSSPNAMWEGRVMTGSVSSR
ncbi:MAG: sugar ABC transporter substrate-binding protein [bacterium]